MARKLRVQYPDALYHVMNRGLDRRALFQDEWDYRAFMEDLEASVGTHSVEVHAYSFLPNHFHLLLRTPRANLSAFMQSIQTRYGVYYNRRHRKSGHVFEGPYRALLVQEDDYLLKLSRYIHLNPVRTKVFKGKPSEEVVKALRCYRWSSYREYIGLTQRRDWMDYDLLNAQVRSRFGQMRGGYRKYVESGLAESDQEWEAILQGGGGLALGGVEFVEQVEELYRQLVEKGTRCPEDVVRKQLNRRAGPEAILRIFCEELKIREDDLGRRRGGGTYRGLAARLLIRHGGLTQREAASYFGVTTGAAISIRIKEAEQPLKSSTHWRKKMERVEKMLSGA